MQTMKRMMMMSALLGLSAWAQQVLTKEAGAPVSNN